jgi:hypothetical protein
MLAHRSKLIRVLSFFALHGAASREDCEVENAPPPPDDTAQRKRKKIAISAQDDPATRIPTMYSNIAEQTCMQQWHGFMHALPVVHANAVRVMTPNLSRACRSPDRHLQSMVRGLAFTCWRDHGVSVFVLIRLILVWS